MPDLSERRHDAWTALAAEPAVRAAERAIVTGSPTILADTLAISVAAESRRRLARVYALKDQAERDLRKRDAYQRAAHDLRTWAADAYLATRGAPYTTDRASTSRPDRADRQPVVKHANPYTEESISLRRLVPRPPFPGQRKRHPRNADSSSETQRADLPAAAVQRDAADARSTNSRKCQGDGMSCNLAATRRSRPGSLSTQPAARR